MYVSMYVCMYVCMYVRTYVRTYADYPRKTDKGFTGMFRPLWGYIEKCTFGASWFKSGDVMPSGGVVNYSLQCEASINAVYFYNYLRMYSSDKRGWEGCCFDWDRRERRCCRLC